MIFFALFISQAAFAVNPGTLKCSYDDVGIISGSPAVGSDGTIYVGSEDRSLYAINSEGILKWSRRRYNTWITKFRIKQKSLIIKRIA